jgi:hypothetical protein
MKNHIKWRANVTAGHYPHINMALSLHKIPATTKAGVALRKTSLKAYSSKANFTFVRAAIGRYRLKRGTHHA